MSDRLALRVRQVEVTDRPTAGGRFDYADCFEVELPQPESQQPQTWVRAGMNDSPAVVEWIADRLGFGSESAQSPSESEDGQVIASTPDLVEIEWSLPLMRVVVIGRRIGPSGRRISSFLYFKRPFLARVVWTVVGIGHRRMARRLLLSSLESDDRTLNEGTTGPRGKPQNNWRGKGSSTTSTKHTPTR